MKFVVLSLWGALSDERPGVSFVSHSLVICLCVHLLFTFCLSQLYTHTHTHRHTDTDTDTQTQTQTHSHRHRRTHTDTDARTQTQTQTQTHTHTHTYIYILHTRPLLVPDLGGSHAGFYNSDVDQIESTAISRIRLMLSPPDACLITARVSIALFPSFTQNSIPFLCRIHREIASGQIHDSK
jgi:hypothetical protein